MKEFYPDIFDHLGYPPHEYGSIQVFVEPVRRDESGRAIATLWMQAAFEPAASGTLTVVNPDADTLEGLALIQHQLPDLSEGKAVRWRLPMLIPSDARELFFRISADVESDAERVRPNWKREDSKGTSDLRAETDDTVGDAVKDALAKSMVASSLTLPFGFVVGLPPDTEDASHSIPIAPPLRSQPAEGFVASIVESEPCGLVEPELDIVWKNGQKLPRRTDAEGPSPQPLELTSTSGARTCFWCGNRVEDAAATPACPSCNSPWK